MKLRQIGGVVATVWKDILEVAVILSMTPVQAVTTVDCRQPDGSSKDIPCPQAVETYNTHMGEVDKVNVYGILQA